MERFQIEWSAARQHIIPHPGPWTSMELILMMHFSMWSVFVMPGLLWSFLYGR